MKSGLNSTRFSFMSLLLVTYFLGHLAAPSGAEEIPDQQVNLGPRKILDHKGMHTTGPSAQLSPDGTLHLTFGGEKQEDRGVFYIQVQAGQEISSQPIRVSPPDTPVATLHEPPALALGPKNDVYITWVT